MSANSNYSSEGSELPPRRTSLTPSNSSLASSPRTASEATAQPLDGNPNVFEMALSRGHDPWAPYALPSTYVTPAASTSAHAATTAARTPMAATSCGTQHLQPQPHLPHRNFGPIRHHPYPRSAYPQYLPVSAPHSSPHPYLSSSTTAMSLNPVNAGAAVQLSSLPMHAYVDPPMFHQPQPQPSSHTLPPPFLPGSRPSQTPRSSSPPKPLAERIRDWVGTGPQRRQDYDGPVWLFKFPEDVLGRIIGFIEYEQLIDLRKGMKSRAWRDRIDPLKANRDSKIAFIMRLENHRRNFERTGSGLPKMVGCYYCYKLKPPQEFQKATDQVLNAWVYRDPATGRVVLEKYPDAEEQAASEDSSRQSSLADVVGAAASAGYGSAYGAATHGYSGFTSYGHGGGAAVASAGLLGAGSGVGGGGGGGGGSYFDAARRSGSPASWRSASSMPPTEDAVLVVVRRYCIECGVRLDCYKSRDLITPWEGEDKKWICECPPDRPADRIHVQAKEEKCDVCDMTQPFRTMH